MMDFVNLVLQNFLMTLGMFFLVRMLLPRPKSNLTESKSYAKVNGEIVNLDESVVAKAECVKLEGYDVWLVYSCVDNSFLTQAETAEKCVENLKSRYPNKAIYVTGLPK